MLLEYLAHHIGVPYIWGGKELKKDKGFDCSGFVQEGLEAIGIVKSSTLNSQNSQSLFNVLSGHVIMQKSAAPGDLLFFGQSITSVTHIAYALGPHYMLECGGGDNDKLKDAGMVRVRPIRKDLVAVIPIQQLLDKEVRI